jgi:hypothetical protein
MAPASCSTSRAGILYGRIAPLLSGFTLQPSEMNQEAAGVPAQVAICLGRGNMPHRDSHPSQSGKPVGIQHRKPFYSFSLIETDR